MSERKQTHSLAELLLSHPQDIDFRRQGRELQTALGLHDGPIGTVVHQLIDGRYRGAALATIAEAHGVTLSIQDLVPGPARNRAARRLRKAGLPVHADDLVLHGRSFSGEEKPSSSRLHRFAFQSNARRARWVSILAAYLERVLEVRRLEREAEAETFLPQEAA